MRRRRFIYSTLAGTLGLATSALSSAIPRSSVGRWPKADELRLEDLAAAYKRQLFEEYLPYWESGGYDQERGGFMCYLRDDGTVQDGRKDIWYQGRGIWVYAFLYNHLDPNPKWLERAQRSRDFMVAHMHRGDGTWIDTVDRYGRPVAGIDRDRDDNIYGALFAAVGLLQLARATGSEKDLELAKTSIRKSVARYEDPSYAGVAVTGVDTTGLRAQGHSFMFTWIVPQLLELDPDDWFESLAAEHTELLAERFWNPDYGISNEVLYHDYSRIQSHADRMVPGHSIEAQWMGMEAAKRFGQDELADIFRSRMRRLIEMSWDYVFGGVGDTDFRVFEDADQAPGPELGIKTMWAQTEVLVGTMKVYADTRATWAWDWYQRAWRYVERTMTTDTGVWRQAVDRQGRPKQRPGISPYRKGNFHQPRCLMMNLLDVQRLIR